MTPKREKSPEGDYHDDRISHLPDEILCHILSLIPTVYSVTTCVLSKTWKHLWEYVPKLTFDDCHLHRSQVKRFGTIVNSFLSVHKVKVLEKFTLRCHRMNQLNDATKWLSNSVIRNIQSLDLNIIDQGAPIFKLPSCIFSCKTLESLMLEGNILFIVPSHVCLPKLRTLELVLLLEYQDDPGTLISLCSSLESFRIEQYESVRNYLFTDSNHQMLSSTLRHIKLVCRYANHKYIMVPSNVFTFRSLEKLSLQGSFFISALPTICMPNLTLLELVDVKYQDDQIFSTLISSCTSLESLNVVNISMEAELNISSCKLKFIELKLICHSNPGHKLVINAPVLKKLKLNIRGRVDCHIVDLASLEQADVKIHFDPGISHDYCSSSLMDIYKAVQHVKSLKVEHKFPRGCGFGHALPMFTRLTELHINIHSHKCGVLLEFIINSTKLENLTLNGLCGISWNNPNCLPPCLLTSLRNVSITRFRGGAGVTLMAKYFIENARILEKMKVCFDSYSHNMKKVSKKIMSFCRASGKCEVLINQMTSADFVRGEVRDWE